MKLEFVENNTEKLIRLYDFDHEEVKLFRHTIQQNLVNKNSILQLDLLPFVQAVNCTLALKTGEGGNGIEPPVNNDFVCLLPRSGYVEITELLKPFLVNTSGFQWLYDTSAEIGFLFSLTGHW